MILLGSLVNAGAILVGGLVGMFAGKLLPERLRRASLRWRAAPLLRRAGCPCR